MARHSRQIAAGVLCGLLVAGAQARAQGPPPTAPTVEDDTDALDRRPDAAQPDYTVVALPTSLRLPRGGSAFRLTHRFARPLADGSFGDLAGDLFGLDAAAQIGLEFRVGVWRGLQVGVHRTNADKTIAIFGTWDAVPERHQWPVGVNVYASVEGTNNLRDHYTQSVGVVFSRTVGRAAALYVTPLWVGKPATATGAGDIWLVGVGGRARVRPSVYVVAEFVPRLSGNSTGTHTGSVGVEKRAGGHVFQLNVSNSLGTTPGQLAEGGLSSEQWFLGFNISRKFF